MVHVRQVIETCREIAEVIYAFWDYFSRVDVSILFVGRTFSALAGTTGTVMYNAGPASCCGLCYNVAATSVSFFSWAEHMTRRRGPRLSRLNASLADEPELADI